MKKNKGNIIFDIFIYLSIAVLAYFWVLAIVDTAEFIVKHN